MKHWNWWLAWQVLRGRVQSVSYDRNIHASDRVLVELTNDPRATHYPVDFRQMRTGR
jgi:hypothetical protein